jgi:hypothetical protein
LTGKSEVRAEKSLSGRRETQVVAVSFKYASNLKDENRAGVA